MTAAPVVHRQPVLSHRPHAARPRPLRLPCTFRLPRMQPVGVVRLLGGQATAVQILAECSRRQLAASVRAGTVLRARRGVYVLPALLDPLQVAARVGGVSSHRSAAQILGYGLAEAPADVDVTVRHGDKPARVPGSGCTGPGRCRTTTSPRATPGRCAPSSTARRRCRSRRRWPSPTPPSRSTT